MKAALPNVACAAAALFGRRVGPRCVRLRPPTNDHGGCVNLSMLGNFSAHAPSFRSQHEWAILAVPN
jgi:hypothetical protein